MKDIIVFFANKIMHCRTKY